MGYAETYILALQQEVSYLRERMRLTEVYLASIKVWHAQQMVGQL